VSSAFHLREECVYQHPCSSAIFLLCFLLWTTISLSPHHLLPKNGKNSLSQQLWMSFVLFFSQLCVSVFNKRTCYAQLNEPVLPVSFVGNPPEKMDHYELVYHWSLSKTCISTCPTTEMVLKLPALTPAITSKWYCLQVSAYAVARK